MWPKQGGVAGWAGHRWCQLKCICTQASLNTKPSSFYQSTTSFWGEQPLLGSLAGEGSWDHPCGCGCPHSGWRVRGTWGSRLVVFEGRPSSVDVGPPAPVRLAFWAGVGGLDGSPCSLLRVAGAAPALLFLSCPLCSGGGCPRLLLNHEPAC